MARKRRTDSIAARVSRYATQEGIQWPKEIAFLRNRNDRNKAYSIFSKLVESRTADDWRSSDLILVAELANCHAQANKMFTILVANGFEIDKTLATGVTTTTRHHLFEPWKAMQQTILAMRARLGLGSPKTRTETLKNRAQRNPAQTRPQPSKTKPVDWAAERRKLEAVK